MRSGARLRFLRRIDLYVIKSLRHLIVNSVSVGEQSQRAYNRLEKKPNDKEGSRRTMIDDHAIDPSVTALTPHFVPFAAGPERLIFLSSDAGPNKATRRI
jgi:hypothetical protein